MTKTGKPRARRPAEPHAATTLFAPVDERLGFAVVGLGASAGGLAALGEFLENMPPDSGMAFIVVTHQHPSHVSLLPELLARRTSVSVSEITDGAKVEPNHVYVAPPGKYIALLGGVLHLMSKEGTDSVHLPVDYFFRSLAADQKERAVAIILSGTGADGSLGLAAIHGEAGLVMAQEPTSAQYPGMPQSAIATRMVDFVLPAKELPTQLLAYVRGRIGGRHETPGTPQIERILPKVFVLLRNRTGNDFSIYKPSTILRRIERRMKVHRIEEPSSYVRYLEQTPTEVTILFHEFLIGVTSFFRDPDAWAALETRLVGLIKSLPEQYVLRAWCAGCSTGEEAYSLAILLRECLDRAKCAHGVQIFATDLDPDSIEVARAGHYPAGIAANVSEPRLRRFFTKQESGYQVGREIREMVVFAPHNMLTDPPFTKLDILLCRNVLIYFDSAAQHWLLPVFHYTLGSGGVIMLGPSESTTGFDDLFSPVDKKWRIFTRKDTADGVAPPMALSRGLGRGGLGLRPLTTTHDQHGPRIAATAQKYLLQANVPATVLISSDGNIAYIHGKTGAFLEPAAGEPSHNLFLMAREGLRLELTAAVREAAAGRSVVRADIPVHADAGIVLVKVSVTPVEDPEALRGLYAVAFETQPEAPKSNAASAKPEPDERGSRLELELQRTRASLQGMIEQLETSNEELKSTNEELQSTNEELQSANEELETSKEETQSLNEELQIVNAELQAKMEALSRSNDDMQNLLNSTEIATLFLDLQLRIKRFTAQATKLIRLIPADVGRPISDLANHLRYDRLAEDAAEVLRTLERKEAEVCTVDGAWRLMRIVPYRTSENLIDGLVVTFVDIDRLKRVEQASDAERALAESIVETAREPFVVLDGELRIVSANAASCRAFAVAGEDLRNRLFFTLTGGRWSVSALRPVLDRVVTAGENVLDAEVAVEQAGAVKARLLVNARRFEQAPGLPVRILLAFEDITEPRATT